MIINIPIRIESTPNLREHWTVRAKRAGKHKHDAWFSLKAAKAPHELPCVVRITRVAPRELDTDNLIAGCKALRDGVALWLQVDDADPRVFWVYDQRKDGPKEYAAEVEIDPARLIARTERTNPEN